MSQRVTAEAARAKVLSLRDIFQMISIGISIATIAAVIYRARLYHEQIRLWLVFILISVITILYYIAVFIDARSNIMNSGDVSSTLRLISQIALMLYVIYAPRRPST